MQWNECFLLQHQLSSTKTMEQDISNSNPGSYYQILKMRLRKTVLKFSVCLPRVASELMSILHCSMKLGLETGWPFSFFKNTIINMAAWYLPRYYIEKHCCLTFPTTLGLDHLTEQQSVLQCSPGWDGWLNIIQSCYRKRHPHIILLVGQGRYRDPTSSTLKTLISQPHRPPWSILRAPSRSPPPN